MNVRLKFQVIAPLPIQNINNCNQVNQVDSPLAMTLLLSVSQDVLISNMAQSFVSEVTAILISRSQKFGVRSSYNVADAPLRSRELDLFALFFNVTILNLGGTSPPFF